MTRHRTHNPCLLLLCRQEAKLHLFSCGWPWGLCLVGCQVLSGTCCCWLTHIDGQAGHSLCLHPVSLPKLKCALHTAVTVRDLQGSRSGPRTAAQTGCLFVLSHVYDSLVMAINTCRGADTRRRWTSVCSAVHTIAVCLARTLHKEECSGHDLTSWEGAERQQLQNTSYGSLDCQRGLGSSRAESGNPPRAGCRKSFWHWKGFQRYCAWLVRTWIVLFERQGEGDKD